MLEQCKVCQNKKFDFETGIKCGLTGEKPDFNHICIDFVKSPELVEQEEQHDNRMNREIVTSKSSIVTVFIDSIKSKNVDPNKESKWLLIIGINTFVNLLIYLFISAEPIPFLFGFNDILSTTFISSLFPSIMLNYPLVASLTVALGLITMFTYSQREKVSIYKSLLIIISIIYGLQTLYLLWVFVFSLVFTFYSVMFFLLYGVLIVGVSLFCHIFALIKLIKLTKYYNKYI